MNKLILLLSILMSATPLLSSELRVVCLGDSITGPIPGTHYLDHYAKYADLLQLILETHLGAGKAAVTNCGYAGNGSAQALARVDSEVLPVKPNIVTVLIGGNDFSAQSPDRKPINDRLRQNLTTIVEKCKSVGAKVLLLQYADPKAADMSKVWTHLNEGNPVIAEIAKAEGVPTLELAPAFREAAKTHPLAELASPIDGVHLNPFGEIVIARAIFFKFQELNWITPAKSSSRD
jgi:lysophospholipase L1-like esterase